MAETKKTGGGQARVRQQLGKGRMVRCHGMTPAGQPCQRARWQSRGFDEPYDCGEHWHDRGRPQPPLGARVSSRRSKPRRWERRK